MPPVLTELTEVIRARAGSDPEQSYTARLLGDNALNRRKIMEEAFEVCLELEKSDVDLDALAEETADLLYHLLVGLVGVGADFDKALAVLGGRRQ